MDLRAETIILKVARERGISVGNLLGSSRLKHFVAARKAAIRRVHDETSLSKTEIGKLFGYKDHTTVLHHLGDKT